MFSVFNESSAVIERLARIIFLDDFGCDGVRGVRKMAALCGRFLQAARANNKRDFMLIENQDVTRADDALMENRLPEVLLMNAEYLIYYCYPRNIPDPETQMEILGAQFRNWANSRQI